MHVNIKLVKVGLNIHHEFRLAPPLRVRLFEEALYFSGSKFPFDINPTDGAIR